ncbi:unnamed protein product [Mytilus coruscus]|uniref:Uncharacterized protein n=1 Tax=Mytilus coruscus TaxID=42192 RepID=A0A6J8D8Y6_MYTCO|nr:unnamed protein product [Mytilus coruscus]
MGQADFNIKINDKIWKQRFVIAEIDAPAIIGYNFLYSKNCKLDIRHSKLTIEDFEIVCQKESQMSSIFKIASEQNVILPPNSETIIMSKVLGDSSHLMDAMIEPIMKQDNEILVARALVDPSNGRIPLRIANLTSFESTLYKSTCLAECHLCDNILEIENTERTSRKVFKIKDSKADEVPEHLVTLFKNSISNLTEEQRIQLKGVLKRQAEAFANSKNELGSTA